MSFPFPCPSVFSAVKRFFMRPMLIAIVLGTVLAPAARAVDPRHVDDAPLRAVQFVDANEGWAVGDEGGVWHTSDGGRTWDRQATGIRASLRPEQFLDPS